jgi:DNA-binding transcriptional ArsR family regulator
MPSRPLAPRTYWIDRPEQIRALALPLRHELGDRLAALGPSTVARLAAALGRRPTAIYHHLRQLEAVGLVRASHVEGERGRPAQVWETVAPLMRMARAGRRRANHAPMATAGSAAASRAGRDYAQGFRRSHWAIEGPGRNHWFFRFVSSPSPSRLRRINALLDRLAALLFTSDPAPGPPISVAWFLSPLSPDPKGGPDARIHPRVPRRRPARRRGAAR